MNSLTLARDIITVVNLTALAQCARGHMRGTPVKLLELKYGLWVACSEAAFAAVDLTAGHRVAAAFDIFLAAVWLSAWFRAQPPRPPKRRRALAPAESAGRG